MTQDHLYIGSTKEQTGGSWEWLMRAGTRGKTKQATGEKEREK